MSYRKITVDGHTFQWVAGKLATKVRDCATGKSRLYPHAEWATPVAVRKHNSAERGVPSNEPTLYRGYTVAPGDVAGMVRGQRRWQDYECPQHPGEQVTGVCASPLASEVYNRGDLMRNCSACLYDVAMEI